MPDYSQYGVPRPVDVGREVRLEQRRSANRAAIFALAGVLVLCVCLLTGITGAVLVLGSPQSGGKTSAISLPLFSGATPTPTDTGKPTTVPFLKGGKNESGLRLTVTAYQRPLPAQDIQIPDGQELALVTVRLDNTRATGGPLKFSYKDFKLVSPEGDSFSPNAEGITTGSMLKDGEIAPGKSVTGDLVFFVYSDVDPLMLAWNSADGLTRLFKLTR